MKKSEFILEMSEYAKNYGEVIMQDVDRSDRRYYGMFIKRDGIPSPIVDLDTFYTKYDTGIWDLDECFEQVDSVLQTNMDIPFDPKNILDWDWVSKRLYLRLLGNVNSGICQPIGDMYLVPYIQIRDDDSATVRVTLELLDHWGVSSDDVFITAKSSQETLRPATIKNMAEVLGFPADEEIPLYIVSTENNSFGASAILYTGVADKLRNILDGDFYILPSSVHEVIVLPKGSGHEVSGLIEMVTAINQTELRECDRLSNSVYIYDFVNHTIKTAA